MGLYDTVIIEEGVELPKFPEDLDPQRLDWQTKDIGYPSMEKYKITSDGRLLRHEESRREKTEMEKKQEAEEHGFDSWKEYKEEHERLMESEDALGSILEEGLPPFIHEETVDEEWWADHNMHGSFEFHASGKNVEEFPDFYFSYEARFTRGELDEIVFLGERGGPGGPDTDIE